MNIGIAQIRPVKGDIMANIENHARFIKQACSLNAEAIFFPELSLTGYEPELAADLATHPDDIRFDRFKEISTDHTIYIGLGVPTKTQTGIRISMIIFQPHAPRQIYSKQHLHPDELPFFEKGNSQILLTYDDIGIAPAICYESLLPAHVEKAAAADANVYVASVAKSQKGIELAMIHYPEIAVKYAMFVCMSNCVGYCDQFESAGQSAVWTKQGMLLAQMDSEREGLLVFDTKTENVTQMYF